MRTIMKLISILLLSMFLMPSWAFANSDTADGWLVTSRLDKGAVGIRYEMKNDILTKVRIKKGDSAYVYSLMKSSPLETEWFPVQMGDGSYEVAVLENVSGNKYRIAAMKTVEVKVDEASDVFLNPVQNVDWVNASKTVAKAKELTRNSKTDAQKVTAIYKYVVGSIRYDKELAKKVQSEYVPDLDETLVSRKAICYGYASLFAAMLRSEGIPTKVVMGTSTAVTEYHAWNEVLLNGKWVVVDTTVDAGNQAAGNKTVMAKKAADYQAEKIY
ncbi:transglutaminase domain-containing protein [Cohnella sp. CFH 77786]|uniref:transglutaminase-like domain-containing protein n=1 Tax=Cohnella sp. CFH 77786 TaxID=2662265 RepID=UPI001C60C6AF|nr:transglutaminase-like domain-containing protein [Cohnella sp. CFH 77786]MBW5446709.1 transglutaminase domain-containing protein [Cohnella sp. CFH 77786]